jgi:hypothetical protein
LQQLESDEDGIGDICGSKSGRGGCIGIQCDWLFSPTTTTPWYGHSIPSTSLIHNRQASSALTREDSLKTEAKCQTLRVSLVKPVVYLSEIKILKIKRGWQWLSFFSSKFYFKRYFSILIKNVIINPIYAKDESLKL